ncbi:cytochrome c3 family protein [Planctomycetota bacterium]
MTRTIAFALSVFAAVVLGLLVVVADQYPGPETIAIDTNSSGKAVKAFPHRRHQQLHALNDKCATCHRQAKTDEKPKKCGSCHKAPKERDPKTGALGFKPAFHDRCGECHKKQKRPELRRCRCCHE